MLQFARSRTGKRALLPAALKYHREQMARLRRNRTLVLTLWLSACLAGTVLAFMRTANSDAAKLAFDQAKISPIMIHSLGQPMRRSPFALGDLETRGSEGQASVSLSVYDPRGRGTLYADAVRFQRSWQLISFDLELPDHPGRLNLMPIQSTVPR